MGKSNGYFYLPNHAYFGARMGLLSCLREFTVFCASPF